MKICPKCGAAQGTPELDCRQCAALAIRKGPRCLAIMQNQWLKDPATQYRALEDAEKRRGIEFRTKMWRRMIQYALFAGCQSGRVLKRHLGEELCEEMVWDEASKIITDNPKECPPADLDHIRRTLEDVKPDVVITFGRIASDGVDAVLDPGLESRRTFRGRKLTLIQSPHPAARGGIQQESVREACAAFRAVIGRY